LKYLSIAFFKKRKKNFYIYLVRKEDRVIFLKARFLTEKVI